MVYWETVLPTLVWKIDVKAMMMMVMMMMMIMIMMMMIMIMMMINITLVLYKAWRYYAVYCCILQEL